MENLYEYAVIRVVPRVEREEFINAGVILFCKKTDFLGCRFAFDANKVKCICPDADIPLIEQHLKAFEEIACGSNEGSPIALLPAAERFRWLTATRSTIIQCSRVHPGIAENEQVALDNLMQRFFAES